MTNTELCEHALDIMDNLKDEEQRKITYCVQEIMFSEGREDADILLLADTLKRIVR